MDVELRIVLLGHDQQVLGQRQLPLAEDGVGVGQQFLRFAAAGIRDVALAADRQQQRMHAGRVDRVDRVHAGDDRRQDRPGEVVDQLAERGVFLRRSADDGERPDGAGPVIDGVDVEHGKVVRQAVIAEMVAERAFGQQLSAGRRCR